MDRTILHADMDAFFAAVEQHDDPALRGKPVVIGAPPDRRGVVSAASYEAREYGIHSAMPSREAGRRCPHAVFLPVNGKRYRDVSKQIFGIFERFTPLLEPLSIDEAFLDVTGVRRLFGTGPEVAAKIKSAVRAETGLTVSVGVAANKFLAKLASDMNKPDGLTVVPGDPDGIVRFLAPLPIGRLWGVGPVTGRRFEALGIATVGQLRAADTQALEAALGHGATAHLKQLARGEDVRGLELERIEQSMSKEHTFDEDCDDAERIRGTLCDLVEDVGWRLREAGKYAALAHLKLRWQGFKTITRQRPFLRPCCDTFTLREMALDLLEGEELIKPVRLVGFGVSRLQGEPGGQLDLFAEESRDVRRRERLSRAVDQIRRRHGRDSIGRP